MDQSITTDTSNQLIIKLINQFYQKFPLLKNFIDNRSEDYYEFTLYYHFLQEIERMNYNRLLDTYNVCELRDTINPDMDFFFILSKIKTPYNEDRVIIEIYFYDDSTLCQFSDLNISKNFTKQLFNYDWTY